MNFPFFGAKAKAAPGDPRPPAAGGAPWLGGWAAATPPRSYEAQVRAGYIANPIVSRAVRIVADGIAGAPVISTPAAHPALALFGRDGALLETVAANLLLHGNAYLEVALGAGGLPVALFPLRPERITVEADSSGWPTAYLYRAGATLTRYPAETRDGQAGIIHLKSYHPLSDWYGLGCLGAAAAAVEVHSGAARWNQALLDNAARPSGALVYDPGDGSALSAAQFARLKDQMGEQYQGAANAGRPMLLDGGMKWQPLSLTPAEMDFVRVRDNAAREIALAFGVPPMLLGLQGDATYANYREANVALWRLTLLPLAARILGGLSRRLQDWWPDLHLDIDRDQVPALAGDRAQLWAQVTAASFLSDAEKRAMLGLEMGR